MLIKDYQTENTFKFKNDNRNSQLVDVTIYLRPDTAEVDISVWYKDMDKADQAYAHLQTIDSPFTIEMLYYKNHFKHLRPEVLITMSSEQHQSISDALELVKHYESIDPQAEKEFLEQHAQFIADIRKNQKIENKIPSHSKKSLTFFNSDQEDSKEKNSSTVFNPNQQDSVEEIFEDTARWFV